MLRPFSRFCVTIGAIPESIIKSMSYEEQLFALVKFLKCKVIPSIEGNTNAIKEIEKWIDTLDIQDEVNDKLDKMAEDGTLARLMENYVVKDLTKKSYYDIHIGTKQNSEEKKYTVYEDYINFGEPNEPPLLDNIPNKGLDIIGHFYNDFGLKSTAMSPTQEYGSWKWYDWSWNFSDTENYDPSRVPLLGYYQGDDRKTLDWILYWLGKSGINVLSLVNTNGFNTDGWENESSPRHWEYVLLNQCKNIKNFKIIPWLLSGFNKTTSQYDESVDNYINFLNTYKDNAHSYTYNGKNYATIYVWEFEGIRGTYDNYEGETNTLNFFKNIASRVKEETSFDGLCLIGRHYGRSWNYKFADSDNFIAFQGNYSDHNGNTYAEYANTDYNTDRNDVVLNVMTSAYSHPFHTSEFNCPGSTPELFNKKLNKAIQTIITNKNPKMLTIYNVSEWAEGGAGLIPNIQDGFGYLDAVAGCQIINNNNIDVDELIENTKEYILSKSHDLVIIKKQISNISSGTNTPEFDSLYQYFNSTYNSTDYVFMISLETGSTDLSHVTVASRPNFSQSRVYAKVYNSGSTLSNLSDVYINLIIIKKNS